MSRRVRSMRRTLLTGVFLVVSSSMGISALLGFFSASHEMEELFDARLAQSARITERLLLRYLETLPAQNTRGVIYQEWESEYPNAKLDSKGLGMDNDRHLTSYGHEFERNLAFQLVADDGTLLLRSPSAPPLQQEDLRAGFGQIQQNHHTWRTFTLHNEARRSWLVVAERDDERRELAGKMSAVSMLPLIITLPLLLGLLWILVSRAVSPLSQLARAIAERHPANLTPLQIPQRSKEVGLLIGELNRLMHTVQDTLERERQFTNEAAHELRTPLAVLRLYSETARSAEDEEQRNQALGKMLTALDRSDRLLRQLLTQARLDNQQQLESHPLDLREVLRETLANLAPLALKKDQLIGLEAEQPLQISGQSTLLDLLFTNLIDNAIRYTPVKGEITVSLQQEGHLAIVRIEDNGPGVPTELLPRLSERFFRVNPQLADGVGLGMAIVQRIALLHHAKIEIRNRPQGGLEVSVSLPLL